MRHLSTYYLYKSDGTTEYLVYKILLYALLVAVTITRARLLLLHAKTQ